MNRWGVGTDGGPTGDWTNLDDDPPARPRHRRRRVDVHRVDARRRNDETRFWWDGVEHHRSATTRDVAHGDNTQT